MKKIWTKKIVSVFLIVTLSMGLTACGENPASSSNAAATSVPDEFDNRIEQAIIETESKQEEVSDEIVSYADENGNPAKVTLGINVDADLIWDAVIEECAKYDIELTVTSFSNVNLNQLLSDGEIDLNAFQHYAYFEKNTSDLGLDLTPLGEMYIFRLDTYSTKYDSIEDLPDGATIALPNTVVNISRVLKQYQRAGLLTVDPAAGDNPVIEDIIDNPHNFQFVELDSGLIVRSLEDVDAGVVFVRDAVEAGLDPNVDTILTEGVDPTAEDQKRWINLIVARAEDADDPVLNQVANCFQTEAVEKAIYEQYFNAAIPAWVEEVNN